MDTEAARQGLIDAAAWYSLSGDSPAELTGAAARALVAGLDGPALRELAGLPATSSWGDVQSVAAAAFSELGLRFPEWHSDDAKRDALRTLARRHRQRQLSARDLTAWAHANVGHEGPDDLTDFAELDDELDLAEGGIGSVRAVEAELAQAIDQLLASDPRE